MTPNDNKPSVLPAVSETRVRAPLPDEATLRSLVELSAKVVDAAGEFREAAFEKVLEALLDLEFASLRRSRVEVKTLSTLEPSASQGSRRPSTRRTPKITKEAVSRIRPVLDAPPDVVSEFVAEVGGLPKTMITYAVLAFAKKVGVDDLTLPEIRSVVSSKLRIGVADGTLRSSLSLAPSSELGRVTNEKGETVYSLMRDGEAALATAIAGTKKRMSDSRVAQTQLDKPPEENPEGN
jgi:hypothetical protein